MGDRAMAEIKTQGGSLFFYTHWTGHRLPEDARAALEAASARKGDLSYATKIVLDTLINRAGARDSAVGAGVMLTPCAEDEYNGDKPSVTIDMTKHTVSVHR